MPLKTETITLEQAYADLEDDREELADKIAQIPPDEQTEENDAYITHATEASEIERYLGGIEWLVDEYGADAELTLCGLNTQETAEVGDRVDDLRTETITPTKSVNNISSVFWVAKGLVDAPFFNADDGFEDKCPVVRQLPRQVTDWLDSRISDLTTVGDREGNDFEQLVAEKTEKYHGTSK